MTNNHGHNLPIAVNCIDLIKQMMADDRRIKSVVVSFASMTGETVEVTVHSDGRITDARKL
jgi:hypothetical protein